MSSNSSQGQDASGSGGSGGGDDNIELIVAIVALIISVLAFVIAMFQALNQYFASATGYSNCSEAVIGKWSAFRVRRMRWSEFRFEVSFEVPVIFVASPGNKRGPLGHNDRVPIIFLDASKDNLTYTSSQEELDQQNAKAVTSNFRPVHTADNESASWLNLLMAVYRMEDESRSWQKEIVGHSASPFNEPPHDIVVCMQRKRRLWDSIPSDITKPYATTTISHLVEMAAMLGIFWKTFDLTENEYRAQGNGFIIVGSHVNSLGATFTVQKQGPCWFTTNRVCPNYHIKELAFGLAPTIFPRPSRIYADEPKDAGTLQLGSMEEIADTLSVFRCNNETVGYFRSREKSRKVRLGHLFPIAFEILGMVGKLLHTQDTLFRMLPNPTIFHWDPTAFSIHTLLIRFISLLKLHRITDDVLKKSCQVDMVLDWAAKNEELLEQAPTGLNDIGTSKEKDVNTTRLLKEIAGLRAGIRSSDTYLTNPDIEPLVKQVLRVHLQEVMAILNKDADDLEKEGLTPIKTIDAASPAQKHRLLVELYLDLRRTVLRKVTTELSQAKEAVVSPISPTSLSSPIITAAESEEFGPSDINNVWCTLVFRMLCWLLLHDFHKKDIQISKSDVYESRMPVYIV